MKRKVSMLSVHIVINPELWLIFGFIFNKGMFIFSIQLLFIIIQLTKTNKDDVIEVNDTILNLDDRKTIINDCSDYLPKKIKVICTKYGKEDLIFENETHHCNNCNNSIK